MKTVKLDKLIKIAMDDFNWKQVQDIMTYMDWKWFDCDSIPSIDKMKSHVQNLFNNCIKQGFCYPENKTHTIQSGGFEVTIDTKYEDNLYVNIKFIIEEISACEIEDLEEKKESVI